MSKEFDAKKIRQKRKKWEKRENPENRQQDDRYILNSIPVGEEITVLYGVIHSWKVKKEFLDIYSMIFKINVKENNLPQGKAIYVLEPNKAGFPILIRKN